MFIKKLLFFSQLKPVKSKVMGFKSKRLLIGMVMTILLGQLAMEATGKLFRIVHRFYYVCICLLNLHTVKKDRRYDLEILFLFCLISTFSSLLLIQL